MKFEQIVFQPCSNNASQEHYKLTVENPIDITDYRKIFKPNDFNNLMKIFADGKARFWGVVNGKDNVNYKKWSKLQNGDTVLFSWDGCFRSKARIVYTLKNPDFAKQIWGQDRAGGLWENIYFIKDLDPQIFTYEDINTICGYKTSARPQGFRVLDSGKSALILNSFNIKTDVSVVKETLYRFDGNIKEKVEQTLDKLKNDTSTSRIVKQRNEQAILRYYLFGEKEEAVCGICGRTFPVGLMETAHIKKRSCCSDEERCNAQIVMPMCNFGCNDLYERGYIKIVNGKIQINTNKTMTSDTMNYLKNIEGRECSYWNDVTKDFFEYHNLNVK